MIRTFVLIEQCNSPASTSNSHTLGDQQQPSTIHWEQHINKTQKQWRLLEWGDLARPSSRAPTSRAEEGTLLLTMLRIRGCVYNLFSLAAVRVSLRSTVARPQGPPEKTF